MMDSLFVLFFVSFFSSVLVCLFFGWKRINLVSVGRLAENQARDARVVTGRV
jgi:hypothetical protein